MSRATSQEDDPIRTLAAALALTLLLPMAVAAHEPLDGSHWPTADELRWDLQAIGYELGYDASARTYEAEFEADRPTLWRLAERATLEDGTGYDLYNVALVDYGDQPAPILFSANELAKDQDVIEPMGSVLMEIASRMPSDIGIDAAVWYMTNLWRHEPGAQQRTTLPCLVAEFEGGATLVARLGENEAAPGFFGAVAHYDELPGHLDQVEQCKAMQAQAESATADSGAAATPGTTSVAVDYTVSPDEAVAAIEAGTRTAIDVRTPEEFETAHVVGALNIDVEAPDFAERIAELDPGDPYLLYCRSGRRSDLAAQQMAGSGFTDIADAGGLVDLARAGAPVE